MFAFEEAFGVPAGHTLREVASAPLARPGVAGGWRWEHEEYDARGALVAVYESWACGGGGVRSAVSPRAPRSAGAGTRPRPSRAARRPWSPCPRA